MCELPETDPLLRTKQLWGERTVDRWKDKRVAVFGVGGVGGAAVEALMRSGIGHFTLIDGDTVSPTNLNRQIIAARDTLGRRKVDCFAERIASVFPDTVCETLPLFFLPGEKESDAIDFSRFDYVIDAVDTVAAKVEIIRRATEAGVPVISAMGAGRKRDPMGFICTDLSKTDTDPLAKAVRLALRRIGITHCKVVFSREIPAEQACGDGESVKNGTRRSPGSDACVPAAAGLLIASTVLRELAQNDSTK